MSGGGYSPPEVNIGGMGPTDCSRLRFETTLTSVDPSVLSASTVGDLFDVRLSGTSAPALYIGVYARGTGLLLGTITDRWAELKRCLELETIFRADLLTDSAPVRVLVESGL